MADIKRMTTRPSLLVALLLSAALLTSHVTSGGQGTGAGPATNVADTVVPFALSPLHDKPPLQWSVRDVEHWMNHTIGFTEYAGYVRANLIDGVTLLEMEPADFESYLPIENALHVIKISAHLKLLKGLCKCHEEGTSGTEGAAMDLWQFMKQHSVRTWTWGTTVLFFPRWAMAGAYLVDKELYLDLVGKPAPMPAAEDVGGAESMYGKAGAAARRVAGTTKAAVFWVSFVVAPDVYMAYHAARLTPRNYILMPCFIAHFLAQAFSECSLLITIYRGTAFKPGTPLREKVWNIFSYTLFAPVLGVVVGFAFPVFLQYVTVAVIVGHSCLMILGIVILVMRDGLSAATTGPEDPKFRRAAEEAGDSPGNTAASGDAGEAEPKSAKID